MRPADVLLVLLGVAAAAGDLPALRDEVRSAEVAVASSTEALAENERLRDAAERELEALKREAHEDGGFFAERRVRRKSADARALVERGITLLDQVRSAEDRRDGARRALRSLLFAESARLISVADTAARENRTAEASAGYAQAAALLAEAAGLAPDGARDPWAGMAVVFPLTGRESAAERAAIARAYRDVEDRVSRVLERLESELAAADAAVDAWDRLSRFRGVLERAGAAGADPRPMRDGLRDQVARGRTLRDEANRRAGELEETLSGDYEKEARP